MTQVSLPQAGSGVGDSGPYTADDWAKFFEVTFTGDQAATQGPLRNYLNELEATRVGNTVSINTGAGFCYGHWVINDAIVDITANACAGVETRWDRVVLVQNETAVAYNTNLLLPAAYAAGIPRNSCRIAILRGVCGSPGVLPALLTGPNYYMVELARYQVTGGAVGIVTDRRDYCEFSTEIGADGIENRTRQIWVPALVGYQVTAYGSSAGVISLSQVVSAYWGPYLVLPDAEWSEGQGRFVAPADYGIVAQSMTIKSLVLAETGAGNVYADNHIYVGECGNVARGQHSSLATSADALTGGASAWYNNCIHEFTSDATIAPGDIIFLTYRRRADNALDTVNDDILFCGWIIEYTADS